jgi:uncharacterized protein (TIGR02996 family)
MTTATDGAGLLAAILADPADDLPRLVMADWLEESGRAERAEFVRCQVLSYGAPKRRNLAYREWERLDRRARALLLRHWPDWVPRLSPDNTFEVILSPKWTYSGTPAVEFIRGFVESVQCPLDAWREHGPAIVRAHPVTRVELTDKSPWTGSPRGEGVYGWWPGGGAHGLPPSLLRVLAKDRRQTKTPPTYDSHDDTGCVMFDSSGLALDALSDAALAWANLPEGGR